jgi:hypothetical protein
MTNAIATAEPNRARHRDQMVICPGCERRVARKSRQQTYCSTRCRKRGAYAKNGRNGRTAIYSDGLGRDSGLGTDPHRKDNDFNALQWSKSGSSTGIHGARRVVEAELFAGREWREVTSSDGVRSQVGQLTARALLAN